jgi:hypothetical protein
MSATIHKLDDYRKTPRKALPHETAIDRYIDQERARISREETQRFETLKRDVW